MPVSEAKRLAKRRYYERHKERLRAERQENRKWLDTQKTSPCSDCGVLYPPCCMDFDHRDQKAKTFGVGNNMARKREALAKEIAKCDLVCANCHRVRTHMGGKSGLRRAAAA